MKHLNKFIIPLAGIVFIFSLLSLSSSVWGQSQQKSGDEFITVIDITENSATVKYWNMTNGCLFSPSTHMEVWVNGSSVQAHMNVGVELTTTISFSERTPNSTYEIGGGVVYWGTACDYTSNVQPINITLDYYQPVVSVNASDDLYGDKVIINWVVDEKFDYHSYNVYCNNVLIASHLTGTSYTHTNAVPGQVSNYSVEGVVNGATMSRVSDNGSRFDINFTASTDEIGKVKFQWNDFSGTAGASGYDIKRYDGVTTEIAADYDDTDIFADTDNEETLIPGYMYEYIFEGEPVSSTGIQATANGKVRPNGVIRGKVKTPSSISNPMGVGVPNVKITAQLLGDVLPTDTTTTYITYTDENGDYELNDIYYYTDADFNVTAELAGHVFDPENQTISLGLSPENISNNNDFTDISGFSISGTVNQETPSGICPMPGVRILVDNVDTDVISNENGDYSIILSQGGEFVISVEMDGHSFIQSEQTLTVSEDVLGINFTDTTTHTINGYITASCNQYCGDAELQFSSIDGCYTTTINSSSPDGYYEITLPARGYEIMFNSFTSFDENVVTSADILNNFIGTHEIDLTSTDSTLNFTYHVEPELTIDGLNDSTTCQPNEIPLLTQNEVYNISFYATESFDGSSCPADGGYIIINQNISSYNVDVITDTIYFESNDTAHYDLYVGTPNIIDPYTKFIEAILVIGNDTDTLNYDVIVEGFRPREQTFTTVAPEMPTLILHAPPGDGSSSYFSESNSNTISFSQNYAISTALNVWGQAKVGVKYEAGQFVFTEFAAWVSLQNSMEFGSTLNSSTELELTTTITEELSASESDVFVGGAMNLIYALTDEVAYNSDSCRVETSTSVLIVPDGFATTFIYTEDHIQNVVIPELQSIYEYYNAQNNDSALLYQNQINVWNQILEKNQQNIADAEFIENISFSGGTEYSSTVETSTSESISIEYNMYLENEIALEVGMEVGGNGASLGTTVTMSSEFGSGFSNSSENTKTVGYTLSDDESGDYFSVDIKKDHVYGVPAFELVAGRSSCPWEEGTQAREGVQLQPNTYSAVVEENEQAVFILQLANLSESSEEITYDLIFDHTSNPHGAIITLGGSPVVGNVPYPYTITAGESVDATVTISRGPLEYNYEGLKFILQSQCQESISDEVYLNVDYYRNLELTIGKSGEGNINIPQGTHLYPEGDTINLFASPAYGYAFDKWIVNGEQLDTQLISIALNENTTAIAYFTVNSNPQEILTITQTGNGTLTPPAGEHYFDQGTDVHLSAIPDPGHAFIGWTVNNIESSEYEIDVDMSTSVNVTAEFKKLHEVFVSVVGEGTTNLENGTQFILDSTIIGIYASPETSYIFNNWEINGTSVYEQYIQLEVTEDLNIIAYFIETSEPQHSILISESEDGTTIPPAGDYLFVEGTAAVLTAVPNEDKAFSKWIINGIESTNNPVSIEINNDTEVEVEFIDYVVAIFEGNLSELANIYPNPSTGIFKIVSDEAIYKIEVYDLTGKLILNQTDVNTNNFTINLSGYETGIYIMEINTRFGSINKKVQLIR